MSREGGGHWALLGVALPSPAQIWPPTPPHTLPSTASSGRKGLFTSQSNRTGKTLVLGVGHSKTPRPASPPTHTPRPNYQQPFVLPLGGEKRFRTPRPALPPPAGSPAPGAPQDRQQTSRGWGLWGEGHHQPSSRRGHPRPPVTPRMDEARGALTPASGTPHPRVPWLGCLGMKGQFWGVSPFWGPARSLLLVVPVWPVWGDNTSSRPTCFIGVPPRQCDPHHTQMAPVESPRARNCCYSPPEPQMPRNGDAARPQLLGCCTPMLEGGASAGHPQGRGGAPSLPAQPPLGQKTRSAAKGSPKAPRSVWLFPTHLALAPLDAPWQVAHDPPMHPVGAHPHPGHLTPWFSQSPTPTGGFVLHF